MSLEKIEKLIGLPVFIDGNDIDTDRIIPARFMKCVTFQDLGKYAFHDAKLELNLKKSANILISGKNFGCGSSREHAPQALYHWGIRAIIAESFAEIFFGNSITLGIIPVVTSKAKYIGNLCLKNPEEKLEINLHDKIIKFCGEIFEINIPEASRLALINGNWDPISELLSNNLETQKLAKNLYFPVNK